MKKPKTVEMVKSTYQPTKAEKEEEFRVEGSMEEIADAPPATDQDQVDR